MLGEARALGLPFVEITVGRFFEDAAYGGAESLRYRIDL